MAMKREHTRKRDRQLLLVATLSMLVYSVAAADEPAAPPAGVDTSDWKCKYCPVDKGFSGYVEGGPSYVSDSSFKFGEYTGLTNQGTYFIGNAMLRDRSADGHYMDLTATDLGLVSPSIGVQGGKQGKYELFLQYNEIPHFISDTAQTPYLGSGTSNLTLPSGWVNAPTTGGMTALGASLHEVDLETKRKNIGVGATLIPSTHWQYGVSYSHETKEGKQAIAGSFLFNAAQLVEPIDYTTDQVNAFASFKYNKWQAKFFYYGSSFSNSNSALIWQNPYTLVNGNTFGQLALPPDNQFHQFGASAGYQFNSKTRATADIAVGRMEQNQSFLSPTINTTLAVPALPQSSLQGQVNTLTTNLKVVSALTDKLRYTAAYSYEDRDNGTPQATYTQVVTDTVVGTAITNLPYSFKNSVFKTDAEYRVEKHTKLSVGWDNTSQKRTFQEVDTTRENTFWGKVIVRAKDNLDMTVSLASSSRNASSYDVVPEIQPPQNPLLRKFNMANRTRRAGGINLNATPGERVSVGFGLDYATSNYNNSTLGLTSSEETDFNANTSVLISKNTDMHLFVDYQQLTSSETGSQTFSTPDWVGQETDTIKTGGIGMTHKLMKNKLSLSADYTVSQSTGQISVNSGVPPADFPDLKSNLEGLKLSATYQLKGGMSLYGAWLHERYRSQDWALNGVAPNTIPNVLTFGQQAPSYTINVVTLSLRYKF